MGRNTKILALIGIAWSIVVVAANAADKQPTAEQPTAEQLRFFEMKVRPLLAARCFKCHGPKKQSGKLRLDSHAAILTGGESGPALTPGDAGDSLLIEAINYESVEMPPDGKLPADQIAVLTTWVKMGAPWPGGQRNTPVVAKPKITAEDRAFWSFQPLRNVQPPAVNDNGWSRNEIDRFIFRRLKAEGLAPAPEAEKTALIRRVYFDLIGLPPTPQQVDAFVNDKSPQAYEDLIDRLLKSPRYGERWARHWLDLVRYAESDGYRADGYRPHAWRYRDYVIRALNEDKPYDRFVVEQLAGDEIAPDDPDALVATGLLRHWIYEFNQRDVRTQWDVIINDITDVTSDVFLGLGMGCARCHDHKFDPILQEDYFRLRAFFAPLVPRDDVPAATPTQRAQYQRKLAIWKEKTADIRRQIDELQRPFIARVENAAIDKFPHDIRDMFRKPAAERLPLERQLVAMAGRQLVLETVKIKYEDKLKGDAKLKWQRLKKELAKFDKEKPKPLQVAYTVSDVDAIAPPTVIPGQRQKKNIAPGYLTIFDDKPATVSIPDGSMRSTGRRTALARWITSADNPLTSRVMVNRIWQYHLGQGLVATSSDFGHLGEPPSHGELLDYLAGQFVGEGWSIKKLHRKIMTSATYRQSAKRKASDSVMLERAMLKDPTNRLLWRANGRRLDAEQIRDAVLMVSGQLDLKAGGPWCCGLAAPSFDLYQVDA